MLGQLKKYVQPIGWERPWQPLTISPLSTDAPLSFSSLWVSFVIVPYTSNDSPPFCIVKQQQKDKQFTLAAPQGITPTMSPSPPLPTPTTSPSPPSPNAVLQADCILTEK